MSRASLYSLHTLIGLPRSCVSKYLSAKQTRVPAFDDSDLFAPCGAPAHPD
jgi:predicted transcriptional regulator